MEKNLCYLNFLISILLLHINLKILRPNYDP